MSNIYFKLKDNDGKIHDLELIESEITYGETEAKHKMTLKRSERFEIKYVSKNLQVEKLSFPPFTHTINSTTKPIIFDNEDRLPLPFEITENNYILARDLCDKLNKLATIKQNNKPKPLKTEILEILSKIDEPQYDMANKIKKQKQHIKDLENKIRLLKRDNHSLQRNYCKKTTDLNQIKEERDYYQQKLMSWRENGYELP